MQLVPGFNRRFDRSAAGGYLEVRPFDFHRDGPAAAIRFLAPGPNIVGHRDHARFDPSGIDQILREGCLRPRGFSLAVGLNRTIVLAARDLKVPIACLAEPLLQGSRGFDRRRSAPVSMPSACILAAVFGPTPWNFAIGSARHEGLSFVRHDRELAVWLAMVRGELRKELVAGNSGRGCEPGFRRRSAPLFPWRSPTRSGCL